MVANLPIMTDPFDRLRRLMRFKLLTFCLIGVLVVTDTAGATATPKAPVPDRAPAILRTVRLSTSPFAMAVDEKTQRVFVVTSDPRTAKGGVTVLDARSGKVLATVALGAMTQGGATQPPWAGSIVLDEAAGRVLVLSAGPGKGANNSPIGPGHVYVLDAASGRLLHTVRVGFGPCCMMVDEPTHHAFVGSSGSLTLTTLDTATGQVVRTVPFTPNNSALVSPLLVDQRRNRVYVAWGQSLSVIDARSGIRQREIAIAGSWAGSASIDQRNGRVILAVAGYNAPDAYIEIIDATTLRVLRHLTLDQPEGVLAVDQSLGRVIDYSEPDNGSHALGGPIRITERSTGDGRILSATDASPGPTADGMAIALNGATGHLLLVGQVDYSNAVAVFDPKSSRVIRTITVGAGAPSIVVDRKACRVFVSNSYDKAIDMFNCADL